MGTQFAKFDSSVPVLVLKIGRYPLSHGILGAIRSLGRAGVPVYAVSEDRFVPYAFSRFLSGQMLMPTTGREEPALLLQELSRIAQQLGSKSILLPTDDEAAVFVAEQATGLCDNFILPTIEPALPRMLASKRGLSRLCAQHDVAIPATHFARSVEDVLAFARTAQFPIVIKNSERSLFHSRTPGPAIPKSSCKSTFLKRMRRIGYSMPISIRPPTRLSHSRALSSNHGRPTRESRQRRSRCPMPVWQPLRQRFAARLATEESRIWIGD